MEKLNLVYGNDYYDKIQALADGIVRPEGITVTSVRMNAQELFYRLLKYDEYDFAEMSFSSFIIAKTKRLRDWIAIPVFPLRMFFHSRIVCNKNSNIRNPVDLKGKRFGIPEYQMSLGLWTRAALEHDYGVHPKDVTWYVERTQELSHAGASSFKDPTGVSIRQIDPTKNLGEMLINGELDAANGVSIKSKLDRSHAFSVRTNPNVAYLFPDPEKAAHDFFKNHGFAPANHVVIIKKQLYEKHPWVAESLYQAFEESKKVWYDRWRYMMEINYQHPEVARITSLLNIQEIWNRQKQLFGEDVSPYGFERNKNLILEEINCLQEQELIPYKPTVEELFAPNTLDT
ncbi:MAG: PhnD/SsuA/transferrin family substrate-binding protein [Nitrososphaerales archaeon]